MRLIDADELKKAVGSYNPVKFTWEYGDVISVEDIDHAPTVDPVKHGRWIEHVEGDYFWYICSSCGKVFYMVDDIHDYCPHCGALMDEVESGGWNTLKMNDLISRHEAIDALWKALYEYEDKTEKQFQESEDLYIEEWMLHRIFVQNMSDIDRQTILNLSSVDPVKHGRWEDENMDDQVVARCSVCNTWDTTRTSYCPHCGAKMDGDENER